jgi:predicted transcriptional regulator of viral defense system
MNLGGIMRNTRFNIAKNDIIEIFENHSQKTFSNANISMILNTNRRFWRLSESLTNGKFIQLLLEHTKLIKHELQFPKEKIILYSWSDISAFELALSIKRESYLTHYTALFLHNLTEQIPKTVYVNLEQPEKPKPKSPLSQENINRAFSRPQRVSKNIAIIGDYQICRLNGKSTNKLGVINIKGQRGETLLVTDIERTLIDSVVRTAYSGGVFEVLNAFIRAKDKVSINKLTAMLKQLDYVYPYHQAIGFYLERAGIYKDSQIRLLKKLDSEYDFYLTHQMKETEYSEEWKLYYPKGF